MLLCSFILLCLQYSCAAANWLNASHLPDAKHIHSLDDAKLVFVQVLFRHGDRTPIYQIPNDKITSANWTLGGQGFGQLTPLGMKQQMELGQKLRKRYDSFISRRYISNEIYVRSTDVKRTLASAIANMIGFYGEMGEAGKDYPNVTGWPASYVPIPVETVETSREFIFGALWTCKYANAVRTALKDTTEYQDTIKSHQALINKVKSLTGLNEVSLETIVAIRDTLFIEKSNNISYPEGFDDVLYNQLDDLASVVDNLNVGINVSKQNGIDFRVEVARLSGGALLNNFISNMKHKQKCLNETNETSNLCSFFGPLKYYVVSAHDSTIASLFSTFGFKEANFNASGLPNYASCVSIELYQLFDGTYTVKVIYWPELKDPLDLTAQIVGCSDDCPFDQFVSRSSDYLINDMDEYCNQDFNNSEHTSSKSNNNSKSVFVQTPTKH
ncbi:Acid phosphatase [Aphelenchoides bicaudatus]|nr:Acid phosphatase [Aphelenchoides bicaudatus]